MKKLILLGLLLCSLALLADDAFLISNGQDIVISGFRDLNLWQTGHRFKMSSKTSQEQQVTQEIILGRKLFPSLDLWLGSGWGMSGITQKGFVFNSLSLMPNYKIFYSEIGISYNYKTGKPDFRLGAGLSLIALIIPL
jgi:hypothetical protein